MKHLEYPQDPFNLTAPRESFSEYIQRGVREINDAPENFTQPKLFRITDYELESIVAKWTTPIEDKQGSPLKILLDLKELDKLCKFRGEFQKRIVPLIEGLKERGGKINGRKINLEVAEKNFQLTPPPSAPKAP